MTQGRDKTQPRSYRNFEGISEDRTIQAESDPDDAVRDGAETFVRHTEIQEGEARVRRYWVDARVLSIFEGADETLCLKVIARRLVAGAR